MKIEKAEIENFRNLKNICLDFDDVNIIYGENAQGKTNLIEALYLFSGSKSFRGAKDSELINFDSKFAKLKIDFKNKNRNQRAELIIDDKRNAVLNGIKKKSASLLGEEIKAVIFSPVHLLMIKDGPSERRKFIDNALCQIKSNYFSVLKNYNRALHQRNVLLKDISFNADLRNMLYVWDLELAKDGAKIIYQRRKYKEAVLPYAKEIFCGLSGGKEKIDIVFNGSFSYDDLSITEIEEKLNKTFNENQNNDILNHLTKTGPHRDNIEILINGKSARNYGSQGQQRSCVLALKLAEASLLKEMTEEEPVAFLDDVMSELDEKRQDYILNHIKDWQVFITCCDANTILRLKKGKTIKIENGCAVEVK
ncbi:MAG: DNA replication/repair protein RecF [Clostridiales bacterium]|nr:DNA replication/repair protein RecF [Clostridiales bacterium]